MYVSFKFKVSANLFKGNVSNLTSRDSFEAAPLLSASCRTPHNPRCLRTGGFSWYVEITSHRNVAFATLFPSEDERATYCVSQNVTHLLWTGRRAI